MDQPTSANQLAPMNLLAQSKSTFPLEQHRVLPRVAGVEEGRSSHVGPVLNIL